MWVGLRWQNLTSCFGSQQSNTKLTGFILFYQRQVRLGNRTYRYESRKSGI